METLSSPEIREVDKVSEVRFKLSPYEACVLGHYWDNEYIDYGSNVHLGAHRSFISLQEKGVIKLWAIENVSPVRWMLTEKGQDFLSHMDLLLPISIYYKMRKPDSQQAKPELTPQEISILELYWRNEYIDHCCDIRIGAHSLFVSLQQKGLIMPWAFEDVSTARWILTEKGREFLYKN